MPKKKPGSSSENVISGTSGQDELSGIGGSFILSGGRGDDTYWVDDKGDSVEEKNRGGTDTVHASLNWTLSDNVENLTLVEGSDGLDGFGNSENNKITGNSGDNLLDGAGGDDTLIGAEGNDTLIGGDGSDTISGGNGTDVAVFSGLFSDYVIEGSENALSVTSLSTGSTDLLDGVEFLSFDDGIYAVTDLFPSASPVAADDSVTTQEDTPVIISALENDSADLVIETISGASGSVIINPDGTLTYTPNENENGLDEFTYTAVDANGHQTTATVTVTVTAVNDAPDATDDTLTVNADTLYSGTASLLDNDTDIDGDTLSMSGAGTALDSIQNFSAQDSSLTIATASGGTVEVFRDGTYTYTPPTGFSGTDSFAYEVADGSGATSTANVTIDVQDAGTPGTPSGTDPVPYYVEGLIFDDPYRLNAGYDVGTPVVVTYTFLDTLPSYYDSESPIWSTFSAYSVAQEEAVRAMLAEIENFTNITFVEVTDAPATITFGLADLGGYNGLAFRPEGTATGTIASDVWIDTGHAGTEFTAGSYANMNLLHEIGHAIGLDHATLPADEDTLQYSIMDSSPDVYFSTLPDNFQLYDIAALQYLYGANTSYVSGDDIYTFGTFDNAITVLWDGGGHDEIDLSAATYGIEVDLTPGAFGTIAPSGSNNFVIALGAVIEDVTGGAYDDVISGNDAANRINGGAGNDVLSGGAGADVFEFSANWGDDTILDFDTQTDVLDLSQSGAAFSDLDITYADGNATVTFLDDSIVLVGVEALDPAVFVFV
jgi:hypothetical protein